MNFRASFTFLLGMLLVAPFAIGLAQDENSELVPIKSRPVEEINPAQSSSSDFSKRIKIPLDLKAPEDTEESMRILSESGSTLELTINPRMQRHLEKFLQDRGNPVAAAVVVEVSTGNVLAMVQGKAPRDWGATVHSALYSAFPAASLFKTIVSSAAIEVTGLDPDQPIGLSGGCAHVGPTGQWLRQDVWDRRNPMTLRRAYGLSCNGFFAKIAINILGLGAINEFAERFGWGRPVDADFMTEISPINTPPPANSSVQTVGRYAAGFGYVGTSAAHAAWWTLAIANRGIPKPLKILKNPTTENISLANSPLSARSWFTPIISPTTSDTLRSIMSATTHGGTASFAFRPSKFKSFRGGVGGKTGTLTGHSPKGLTTWFTGMMPLDKPEVVVAAVALLPDDVWFIKGPNLAAESLWAFHEFHSQTSNYSR